MGLSLVVRLRHGRFDAAAGHGGQPEWPPHPARVFCALVASASEDADWVALRWLEQAGSPHLLACAPERIVTARRTAFVVTNAVEKKTGSQSWPGRTNGEWRRTSVLPAVDEFAVVWPHVEADDATLGRLVRLARRVAYIGRSTSPAEVSVVPEALDTRDEWLHFEPTTLGSVDSVEMRVPYPGYVDQLRVAYAEGRRAWEVARSIAYAPRRVAERAGEAADADVAAGAYSDLLVFGIDGPVTAIAGLDVLQVTGALRLAAISRVADLVPAQLSGHGADGRPHVAFLGLPDIGHCHADGHLLGVGVAIPADLPTTERRAVLRGLLAGGGLRYLNLPGGRRLDLSYQPDRTRPLGLLPERWTTDRGARSWVTATPVMLDRYPKAHTPAPELLARALVTAGYPRPEQVEMLPGPATIGGIFAPRRGSLPEGRGRRPLMHCRVRFPRAVRGPVIAGALRYLGVGLFVPDQQGAAA